MKKALKCLGVLALCAASQLAVLPAHAEVIAGRVVKVADGDTITVLDSANTPHKIRLAGIDAPEKKQAFGNASRLSLAQLVAGQSVRVETDKIDRYGRSVGVVFASGVDVNRTQLERGMAWWYRAYAREQSPANQAAYSLAEDDARSARRGLWVEKEPIAPWDWRRSARHGVQLELGTAAHGSGAQGF
ncbi:MAG: thermonuclease family protein [Proteobacteria bacterium]|nr:thermonuclease family protein [Pseudomonadota bacterium]